MAYACLGWPFLLEFDANSDTSRRSSAWEWPLAKFAPTHAASFGRTLAFRCRRGTILYPQKLSSGHEMAAGEAKCQTETGKLHRSARRTFLDYSRAETLRFCAIVLQFPMGLASYPCFHLLPQELESTGMTIRNLMVPPDPHTHPSEEDRAPATRICTILNEFV